MSNVKTELWRLIAALAVGGLLLVGPPAQAQRAQTLGATSAAWPQGRSDLAADPSVTFGVLPNGMRYALMHNVTPPGQVSMRLLIRAGSMQEAKGQEGLAHFLEHMAFRGSTHLTDGEVFPKLERLGLARGADSNAGTSANRTVYQFDLPKSDDETVDAGLMVLREIAGELLLRQESMDAERGVILSEERVRDTPTYHAGRALSKLTLGDHPYTLPTIGLRETISTAPVSRIRQFYEAYYRPERAVLVVVGDIDPAAMQAKISAKFSDWRGKGPAGVDPAPFAPKAGEQTQLYTEAGVAPQMIIAWADAPKDRLDDQAREIERIQESLAFSVLNKRYSDLTMNAKPPFQSGLTTGSEILGVARITQLAAVNPTDWREALKVLVGVQRQALEFGVQADELDRVVVQTRASLQAAAAGASARRSPALANGLVNAAASDNVFQSPAQRLALFEEAAATMNVGKANAFLRTRFTGAGPSVFVALPTPPEGGQAALTAAYAEAKARPVSALAAVGIKAWPYTDFGPAGAVVERRRIEDVGVTLVRFANGVRLTIKPTDFAKEQILVRVRTGFGMLDLPADRLTAISGLGTRVIDGGLVDLSPLEVRRSLEGKIVGLGAGVGEQGFTFAGGTRPTDFELQMQILAAYHAKPGWGTDGLAERIQVARTNYPLAETTPSGVFGRNAGLLLHSGDARWRQPTPDEIEKMSPQEARAFMAPILAKAPIEVVIVGDIDVERAIAVTAKTFGALPIREARAPSPASRIVNFPSPTPEPIVLRHRGRSDQGLAVAAWPVSGYRDHASSLRLKMLQLIIGDRLFDQVRAKEGKTYSPQGDLSQPAAFPDYGYLLVMLETPQTEIPSVYAAIDRIVADLAANEVSADELDRVRKPRIELWRRNLRDNAYWAGALAGVWEDEDVLVPARTNIAAYQAVTPADLKAAARAWLAPEKAWRLSVIPQTGGQVSQAESGTRP